MLYQSLNWSLKALSDLILLYRCVFCFSFFFCVNLLYTDRQTHIYGNPCLPVYLSISAWIFHLLFKGWSTVPSGDTCARYSPGYKVRLCDTFSLFLFSCRHPRWWCDSLSFILQHAHTTPTRHAHPTLLMLLTFTSHALWSSVMLTFELFLLNYLIYSLKWCVSLLIMALRASLWQ